MTWLKADPDEPARADLVRRMGKLSTEYTRRERLQDAIVEWIFRLLRLAPRRKR